MTIAEQIGTALGVVATDILAAIIAVAPVGLTIMAGFMAWRYGIRFFKGLSK